MPLIITFNPAFAFFHNPYEYGAFEADLFRFVRLINGTLEPGPTRLETSPTVEDVFNVARNVPFISVDVETWPENSAEPWTGKDPLRARLRKVGLGNTEWGLSHQWSTSHKVEVAIKRVLEDTNILKVAHNWDWFDDRVLKRYGIHATPVEDTRDLRRALSTTSPLRLPYVASLYTDAPPWKEMEEGETK